MLDLDLLEKLCTQTRRDILRMVHKVNSGHPGGSLGCTEYLVTLFNSVMKRNPGFNMNGINEHIFFLSNGHISPVFYSVLARCGYFEVDELQHSKKEHLASDKNRMKEIIDASNFTEKRIQIYDSERKIKSLREINKEVDSIIQYIIDRKKGIVAIFFIIKTFYSVFININYF